MLRRHNFQVLSGPRSIWPIPASLLLHAICLSLVTMPHTPNMPELLTVEMVSLPQFSAPAPVSKSDLTQNAAAVAPESVQSQPVTQKVEMPAPVKPVNVMAPEARNTTPLQTSAPVQAAATAQPGSAPVAKGEAVSAKAGTTAPIGPAEGTFGASNGPSFLSAVQPVYPRIARKLGKEGTVLLRISLDEKGALTSVVIVEKAGHGFDEAAVNAVKASRFRPAKQQGIPVACRALLPFKFKLEGL